MAANTGSRLSFDSAPDIQTREPTEKSLKRYFQVLSEKYLGDILRYVHNAGRYGTGNDVRVDLPAIIVGKGDEMMKRTIKDVDTSMEAAIDSLVRGGLARNVAVGVTLTVDEEYGSGSTDGSAGTSSKSTTVYVNHLYGRTGSDVSTAADCSIVR
ncbi:MAG: hypothetical protein QG650_1021 [Patescibacteria group bacterium]|nr:hypothetical protein [Patescibacteria group bacterium]